MSMLALSQRAKSALLLDSGRALDEVATLKNLAPLLKNAKNQQVKRQKLGGVTSLAEQMQAAEAISGDTTLDMAERMLAAEQSLKLGGILKRQADVRAANAEAHARITLGYQHDPAQKFGGCASGRGASSAPGFQSWTYESQKDQILSYFVACVDRGKADPSIRIGRHGAPRSRVRGTLAGWHKDQHARHYRKAVALDMAYIGLNESMRSGFRIDIDSVISIEELIKTCSASNVPLPNIIVGEIDTAGNFIRPHLWYLLSQAVCFTDRGRAGPQRLYGRIIDTICERLEHIGADMGATRNGLRGKNPLSPLYTKCVLNEKLFSMSEKCIQTSDIALAEALGGLSKHRQEDRQNGESCAIFQAIRSSCVRHIRKFPLPADNGATLDHAAQRDFRALVESDVLSAGLDASELELHRRINRALTWFWQRRKPAKCRKLGPMGSLIGIPEAQAQAQAAARTNAIRRADTIAKIAAAADQMNPGGDVDAAALSRSALAKIAGLDRSTVYRADMVAVDLIRVSRTLFPVKEVTTTTGEENGSTKAGGLNINKSTPLQAGSTAFNRVQPPTIRRIRVVGRSNSSQTLFNTRQDGKLYSNRTDHHISDSIIVAASSDKIGLIQRVKPRETGKVNIYNPPAYRSNQFNQAQMNMIYAPYLGMKNHHLIRSIVN